MNRKKILWVSHFLPFPPKGGAQIRSYNLVKELSRYHDVSFFCLVQEDLALNYFDSLDVAMDQANKIFGEMCKNVIFLPVRGKKSKKLNLIKSLFSLKSYSQCSLDIEKISSHLSDVLSRNEFDFVHLDTISLIMFRNLFKAEKITMNHHNIESLMMERRASEQKNWIIKIICKMDAMKIRRLEKISAEIACVHFVCSDLDGDRLRTMFPEVNAETIPNGIDCRSVINSRRVSNLSLLFIGGLDWYPNADAVKFLLNEIFPIVSTKLPNLSLDIVGKNPSSEIINLASKFSHVKLHGFVNDIAPFYETAWLYICPIRDGGGTKLKVLDAMANGVPLLAHPVAMEGIDAIPGEHYFSASTPQEFAELIWRLSNVPSCEIEEIGNKARELISSSYDYDQIGKTLSSIYLNQE